MPEPLLLLSPDGSRDRNGAVSPTLVGAVRTVPGERGRTWFIEEETRNYANNPIAAINLSGIGATPTATRLTGQAIPHPDGFTIDTSVRVELTAPNTNILYWPASGFPLTQGAAVTGQFLVRGVGQSIGKTVRCYLYEIGGATANQTSGFKDYTLTADWQLLTASATIIKADRTAVYMYCQFYGVTGNPVAAGDILELTAGQIENKSYRTTFAHGGLGSGYSWVGTAHNSNSIRANSRVQMPTTAQFGDAQGTILGRTRVGTPTSPNQAWLFSIGHNVAGSDLIELRVTRSSRTITAHTYSGSGSVGVGASVTFPEGEVFDWALTWNGPDISLRVNQDTPQTLTRSATAGTFDNPTYGAILGAQRGGAATAPINDVFESLLSFDTVLPDAEIDRIFAMDTAWTWGSVSDPGFVAAQSLMPVYLRPSSYLVERHLWKVDRAGVVQELLDGWVTGGTLAHNDDAAIKRTLDLAVLYDDPILKGLEDFVVPELIITEPNGVSRSQTLGQYQVMPSPTEERPTHSQGTVSCLDLSYILQRSTLRDGYRVNGSTDTGQAARTVILGAGFLPSQVQIPNTGKVLGGAGKDWDPGVTRFQVAADLLTGSSFYMPFMDLSAVITTEALKDLEHVTPKAVYRSHGQTDAPLMPVIRLDPDISRLRNVVTVRSLRQGQAPISATWVNENRNSPLYVDGPLGELGETVDDSTITSEADAYAIARNLGKIGESFYQRAQITTGPDLLADAHDVIELDVLRHDVPVYSGRWWRQAWSLSLDPTAPLMTQTLNRVERWA